MVKKPKKFSSKTDASPKQLKKEEVAIDVREAKKDFFHIFKKFSTGQKRLGYILHQLEVVFFFKSIIVLSIPALIIIGLYLFQEAQHLQVQFVNASRVRVQEYPLFDGKKALDTTASSYILYEKDSRVIVSGKNENLRFAPASTAKMMAALVAVEYYPLDLSLSAHGISSVIGSKMGLFEGEEMKVTDLLYGLLLPSGNDAAYVLAQNYPGGVDGFVARMNSYAQELKLYNTEFFDPSGYDDKNFSTALDLVRLASRLLDTPSLAQIVKTKHLTVYDKSGKIPHKLENLNKLLDEENVTGVKTGFTEEAGGVLVTSFIQNKKTYIIVVLRSQDRFADTEEIIRRIVKDIHLLSY